MSNLIDNKEKTMLKALSNALETSDSIDICVGYFYFSGFQALASELKDKKIRILVGMEIDPKRIPDIVKYSKHAELTLEKFAPWPPTNSALQLKQNYMDALITFVNESDTFDDLDSEKTFDMFISKISDGSLEIRKTLHDEHSKFYIIHNKQGLAHGGDFPGTVIMGSSNLTYKGLLGQGELNDSFKDKNKFLEYQKKFDELWDSSNSISIVEKTSPKEFIEEIRSKLWIYQEPTPYEMYIRVLHELYKETSSEDSIKTPSKITAGVYLDFEYQKDAIKIALDRIEKFDGVIISDVVGLGKSIIASAVARNLDMNTVIIAPPHLIPQWEDYKEIFGIKGSKVFSSGNIPVLYERYADSKIPLLLVIDEAHRFRNEDTADYKLLHQICRSNPNNKVMLITATPFNNSPQDIFSLMKLFQTPGQSTIRSIDNLSIRFRELIQKYKKLRIDLRKTPNTDFTKESNEIALEQRRFLEPIVIRRSRLDLEHITRYRKDLERQGVSFPRIEGPTLLEYDLKELSHLYLETLELIGDPDSDDGFIGARYKPATYIVESEKFKKKYGEAIDGLDLKVAQSNLSDFMRKLLVMRFESSKFAFKCSLIRMIENNRLITNWWNQLQMVPIMKKGQLPDPNDFSTEDGEFGDDLENRLEVLRNNKGLLEIPIDWIDPKFILDVEHDTQVLQKIYDSWFGLEHLRDLDPKLDELQNQIKRLLSEDSNRKIIIFSVYADTVRYVGESLAKRGVTGVLSFTAADSSKENRKVLMSNFDASYSLGIKENDYQVLVCTDALSEGVNLHRAGVVINYDIPYNPTRVIQRIGRINRINMKVFDTIHIYNFFPTVVGEKETRVKAISTLKINLINNIVGTDTRTLTPGEDVQSFFKDEFEKADKLEDSLSWDSVYIEEYETALKDPNLMERVSKIPKRVRIARRKIYDVGGIVFSKRGKNTVFITADVADGSQVIGTETALRYFQAVSSEIGDPISTGFSDLFELAKEKLFEKHALPEIRGRREKALNMIQYVKLNVPSTDSYCSDLVRIIREFDDVGEGTLKDIGQIKEKSPELVFTRVRELVPESFVRNVLSRVARMEHEPDVIMLAEEFQK